MTLDKYMEITVADMQYMDRVKARREEVVNRFEKIINKAKKDNVQRLSIAFTTRELELICELIKRK